MLRLLSPDRIFLETKAADDWFFRVESAWVYVLFPLMLLISF